MKIETGDLVEIVMMNGHLACYKYAKVIDVFPSSLDVNYIEPETDDWEDCSETIWKYKLTYDTIDKTCVHSVVHTKQKTEQHAWRRLGFHLETSHDNTPYLIQSSFFISDDSEDESFPEESLSGSSSS